jgi:hypothetical protein
VRKLICGVAAVLALAVPAVAAEAPVKDKDGNYW